MSTFTLPPALARRAEAGGLGHAWLITGAPEPRLEETAKALAAAFLCAGNVIAREKGISGGTDAGGTDADSLCAGNVIAREEGISGGTDASGADTDPLCASNVIAREEGISGGTDAGSMTDGHRAVPCGVCKHCRKVEKGVHPDLQWWEKPSDKSQFIVDQVRALRADAYIRPNEAERKVYVLKNAWQMNDEAQNAFLKVLEEGPRYAVFLLLAENPLALLPTVRSRCETLRLEPTREEDGELERRGGELAGLLLGEERWRMIGWCVPYEKAKREEVLPLWEAARRGVLAYRTVQATPKAVRLAQTLSEIIAAGNQNGNMGVLWGKLWAAAQ